MTEPTNGNRAVYKQLMDQYRSSIEQECAAYESLLSPDLSYSDLVQEVTLHVWQRIAQFKGLEKPGEEQFRNMQFEAWLRKTTRSILNNLYRDRKALKRNTDHVIQSSEVVNEAPATTSSPSSILEHEEECSRVRNAMYKCLDSTLRNVVIMHIHQNHTFPEIADKLGLTYDQVRHKYRSALKQIESELEG